MTLVYGNVSIARAAVDVLAHAGRPLTLGELQQRISETLGREVLRHSLRAAIYYHLNGREAWFDRCARGHYALAPHARNLFAAADSVRPVPPRPTG